MAFASEDQIEGVAVGYVKKRQRRHGGMDVNRIQPRSKHAIGHPTLVQLLDGVDHRDVQVLNQVALRQKSTALDVLRHDQANEVLMRLVVVKGKAHQALQCLLGRSIFELQLGFDVANAAVGLFKHRKVQALFAAEVVVNHALAGVRCCGNGVNARARQPIG